MTAADVRRPDVDPARELCVFVGCHHVVAAIPARFVERLVLADEARTVSEAASGWIIGVDKNYFPAFDLGLLVGLPKLREAWVLARWTHRGKDVVVAFSTGRCLFVQPLPKVTRLPRQLFTSRRGGIVGVFSATSVRTGREAREGNQAREGNEAREGDEGREGDELPAGILLDPRRLIPEEELERAVKQLGSKTRRT